MIVRIEKCADCGEKFTIDLAEFIQKLDNHMKLPRRCMKCRRNRRLNLDTYAGLQKTMYAYPITKGHRHQVHGGVDF